MHRPKGRLLPGIEEKVEASANGSSGESDKSGRSSKSRVIVIVSAVLAAWIGFSYWAMEYGQSKESLFVDENSGPFNTVEVTNDVIPVLYFVPCDDSSCLETPNGTHPGDFEFVTKGNSQEIKVTRSKETTIHYGVFDDNRRLTGCLEFVTTKEKLDVIRKNLSEIVTPCGDGSITTATTQAPTTTSSTTTTAPPTSTEAPGITTPPISA